MISQAEETPADEVEATPDAQEEETVQEEEEVTTYTQEQVDAMLAEAQKAETPAPKPSPKLPVATKKTAPAQFSEEGILAMSDDDILKHWESGKLQTALEEIQR